MKTLSEIEGRTAINQLNTPGDATSKYVIDEPGSYYLTQNELVTTISGTINAIKVDASDVTIDLNGFRLVGVQGTECGVLTAQSAERLVVKNGIITDFMIGIDASIMSGGLEVRGVRVRDCGGRGVFASKHATIDRCVIDHNGSDGVLMLSGSVSRSRITDNGGSGLSGGAFIVRDNIIHSNAFHGIEASTDALITDNLLYNNGTSGEGAGIRLLSLSNQVEDNHCVGNFIGINSSETENFVVRNSAGGNLHNYSSPACFGCSIGFGLIINDLTSRTDAEQACSNYEHD